ncbi:uncharacterized protein METZ01_LOCUS108725 [marine metagenome]|uniref:Polysaccharide biosynthesis protein CapD-like domain-containing protein n=1 Tax=marine metagenome TaxID=408172 RepID=A0A381WUB5_9ZZZZ
MLVDSAVLIIILLSSFSLRLGQWYWPGDELRYAFDTLNMSLIFGVPIIAIPIFIRFGLYRTTIRFIGFNALWEIGKAVSLYALLWGIIAFMASAQTLPRSVIIINWLFAVMAISGLRMFARWLFSEVLSEMNPHSKNVVIYGAGSAGRQLSIALSQSNEYNPVALIDDANEMHRQTINGLEVFSPDNLESLINKKNISEILLAIPSLSRIRRNEIINLLEPYPVTVRSLPSVSDLAQGKVKIDDLRKIDIKDLLGRELVKPNEKLLKVKITDKVVLVTGAGGSIGSELCRQILSLKPKRLILFEISESSLYQIEQELIKVKPANIEIFPILGSVRDKEITEYICNYYSVQTIYHAAAYKHVPLVEMNQAEGVLNNALGTLALAEAAIATKVETFVLISTDKAVRPTNTMGATKRVAELVLQAFAKLEHNTCFTMVRFGNVLDSSGSVIPLFKKQIEEGGPVTVTDENIVRYFMTIPEAVELVIQASAMGQGGDVFVLDMGEPIRINDLAIKMIQLSGLQVRDKDNPDGDIEIKFIGLRPGEKLFEELLVGDNTQKTENPLIMRAEEIMIDWELLKPILDKLQDSSISSNQEEIHKLLSKIVPEFKPQDLVTME